MENQDRQLHPEGGNRGFEGHGIHYGAEMGKGSRLSGFRPVLGLRHPGSSLPGNREAKYRG